MTSQGGVVEPRVTTLSKPLPDTKIDDSVPIRVLVLLDYDDTLIPTTIIQERKYKINHQNTDPKDRVALGRYAKALEGFIRKILSIDSSANVQSLIKIVTTASGHWVNGSLGPSCGSLWTNMIAPFNDILVENQVGVVSVRDFQRNHKDILGDIQLTQCKQVIFCELMRSLFNKGGVTADCLVNEANEDCKEEEESTPKVTEVWKVLCIGDSSVEFEASREALNFYLKERSMDESGSIKVSLHRVKFESQPDTFQKLESELRWCTAKIEEIVHKKHESADYIYSDSEEVDR